MTYEILTPTKQDFLNLTATLPYFDNPENPFTGQEYWSFLQKGDLENEAIQIVVKDLTGQIRKTETVIIDGVPVERPIVLERDSYGYPIKYEMQEGYCANILSTVDLNIPESILVHPSNPQFKFS